MRDGALQKPRFGSYELVRPLSAGPISERWLACHEFDHTSHVVHYFPGRHDRAGQRRFLEAVETVAGLSHAHLLPIEQYAVCPSGRGVVVTPYTGNHAGLVSLDALLELKGGRMGPIEAKRAVTHLLEAIDAASKVGGNGPVTLQQVLVDRHGRASIELYGLGARLRGASSVGPESERDEVRSVVEIGYRLVTGLSAEEPRVPVSKLETRLSPAWEAWLEAGLDPVGGYASALEAIAALGSGRDGEPASSAPGRVRVLLNRFRWPSRSR